MGGDLYLPARARVGYEGGLGDPHSGVSTRVKAKGVVNHSSGGHLELLHHEDLLVDVGLENGLPQEL